MKKISIWIVASVMMGTMSSLYGQEYNLNASLQSDVDSAFYAIGVLQGEEVRVDLKTLPGADSIIHADAFFSGYIPAFQGKTSELKMTPEAAQTFLQDYLTMIQAKEEAQAKETEDAFFASNKTKPGVITTESGLQYRVIVEGTGAKPTEDSTVIVHYIGTFLDGTVIDSSVERGEPATFSVSHLIRGITEVLQLMPVGSKYQVWIPFELAYGAQSRQGSSIKPYSTLEFEIELLGIEPAQPESQFDFQEESEFDSEDMDDQQNTESQDIDE
jgi:FKBP-type peptidyl-prolyl cis-trans isomerase